VKERLEIKRNNSILSIFGLAFLLFISPCKVRNFIQIELGVSQTKVLNKGLSTINQANCQTFETSKLLQTISEPTTLKSNFPLLKILSFEVVIGSQKNSFTKKPSTSQNTSKVPLYLLYQNIKVYS